MAPRFERPAAGGEHIPLSQKHELAIPADRPFPLVFKSQLSAGPIISWCEVAVSFLPEANARYEAEYRLGKDTCEVVLSRVSRTGERTNEVTGQKLPCTYPASF